MFNQEINRGVDTTEVFGDPLDKSETVQNNISRLEKILGPELLSIENQKDIALVLDKTSHFIAASSGRARQAREYRQFFTESLRVLQKSKVDLPAFLSDEEFEFVSRTWTNFVEKATAGIAAREKVIDLASETLLELEEKQKNKQVLTDQEEHLAMTLRMLLFVMSFNPTLKIPNVKNNNQENFLTVEEMAAAFALTSSCLEPDFLDSIQEDFKGMQENTDDAEATYFEDDCFNFLIEKIKEKDIAKAEKLFEKIKQGSAVLQTIELVSNATTYGEVNIFPSSVSIFYKDSNGENKSLQLYIDYKKSYSPEMHWKAFLIELYEDISLFGAKENSSIVTILKNANKYNRIQIFHDSTTNAPFFRASKVKTILRSGPVFSYESDRVPIPQQKVSRAQIEELENRKKAYALKVKESEEFTRALARSFDGEKKLIAGESLVVTSSAGKKMLDLWLSRQDLSLSVPVSHPITVIAETEMINDLDVLNRDEQLRTFNDADKRTDEKPFGTNDGLEYFATKIDKNILIGRVFTENNVKKAAVALVDSLQESEDLQLFADFLRTFLEKAEDGAEAAELIPIVNTFIRKLEELEVSLIQKLKLRTALLQTLGRYVDRSVLDTSSLNIYIDDGKKTEKAKKKKEKKWSESLANDFSLDFRNFLDLVADVFHNSGGYEEVSKLSREYYFSSRVEASLLGLFLQFKDNPQGLEDELVRLVAEGTKKRSEWNEKGYFGRLRSNVYQAMLGRKSIRMFSNVLQKKIRPRKKNTELFREQIVYTQEHINRLVQMAENYWESLDLQRRQEEANLLSKSEALTTGSQTGGLRTWIDTAQRILTRRKK
jgi:hypothetical protein